MKRRSYTKMIGSGSMLLIAGLALMVFSCGRKTVTDAETGGSDTASGAAVMLTNAQVRSAGLAFGQISKQLLSMDVNAKGKLVLPPQSMAQVNTMAGGAVQQILIQEGTPVTAGTPLLLLSSPEIIRIQQDYVSVHARLNMVEQDYRRQELLAKDKITSDKKVQEVTAEYQDTRARYQALRMQLDLLKIPTDEVLEGKFRNTFTVYAPIGGTIEKVQVHLGQYAEPGLPLMTIVDKRTLYIELMVFEKDIKFITTGQRVTFELANLGGEEYEAIVMTIGKTVEENARTVKVLARFINESPFILPGMFVAAEIHTSEQELDALPEEAVVADDQEQYVFFTLDSDQAPEMRFRKTPVKTGFREDGFIQVTPLLPLQAGARIVVKGTYFIKAQGLKQEE